MEAKAVYEARLALVWTRRSQGRPADGEEAQGELAEPCAADPAHLVGESWLCDNKCDTCTCEPDGSITAAGCVVDDGSAGSSEIDARENFEATVVRIALFATLIMIAGGIAVCFFMCCKGGNKNASALVRELEDADNA